MKFKDLKSISQECSISIFTLRKFVKMGMPHYRVGRKILVNPEEFERWFEKFKVISTLHYDNLDKLVESTLSEME